MGLLSCQFKSEVVLYGANRASEGICPLTGGVSFQKHALFVFLQDGAKVSFDVQPHFIISHGLYRWRCQRGLSSGCQEV